ncbi:hypothetical protein ER308_06745 [Egibacter rhizosphaerae]|uniref:Uncharacterized protein n=1 Tax=Egibacter rhizosphaerae TaxID=1670831 RepID=A0A411YDK1_9ACTN|nr:hypothetical protein [Egibacter rhizosphaerae]QBI19270.1 hypothetical protein ER308_06745 [Egibacter rhizosphaerae]
MADPPVPGNGSRPRGADRLFRGVVTGHASVLLVMGLIGLVWPGSVLEAAGLRIDELVAVLGEEPSSYAPLTIVRLGGVGCLAFGGLLLVAARGLQPSARESMLLVLVVATGFTGFVLASQQLAVWRNLVGGVLTTLTVALLVASAVTLVRLRTEREPRSGPGG